MKKLLAIVVFSVMLVTMAQAAGAPAAVTAASNTATAATTLNTNLVLNATINTALALDIQSAAGGCAISSSGTSPNKSFAITFGNVDGLGLSTPTCGTPTKSTSVGGGYLYTTPYKYVARFSGFNPTSTGAPKLQAYYTQTINGVASTSTSAVQLVEGSTAAGATAMGLGAAAIADVATGLTSDETNTGTTRFIGLQVFEYNGANATPNSATGATYAATVTFVLTPQ